MANEKKFLDSSGIGHLWDRIEERYPNMDELGLIIDAIDEAKADRTDLEALSSKVNEVEIADEDDALEDLLTMGIVNAARQENTIFTDGNNTIFSF